MLDDEITKKDHKTIMLMYKIHQFWLVFERRKESCKLFYLITLQIVPVVAMVILQLLRRSIASSAEYFLSE